MYLYFDPTQLGDQYLNILCLMLFCAMIGSLPPFENRILTERIEILNQRQTSKIEFNPIDKKGGTSFACFKLFIPFAITNKLTPKSILNLKYHEKN